VGRLRLNYEIFALLQFLHLLKHGVSLVLEKKVSHNFLFLNRGDVLGKIFILVLLLYLALWNSYLKL
jgi:hypothetical protein